MARGLIEFFIFFNYTYKVIKKKKKTLPYTKKDLRLLCIADCSI